MEDTGGSIARLPLVKKTVQVMDFVVEIHQDHIVSVLMAGVVIPARAEQPKIHTLKFLDVILIAQDMACANLAQMANLAKCVFASQHFMEFLVNISVLWVVRSPKGVVEQMELANALLDLKELVAPKPSAR
eukprot:TRINITY_DN21339_c0_g2_i1.p2 TRINITY_DN21339_c0_g2~~TRINITY_DN21339_c0_g2_i1.p2  ORF type:complete len:131 (-),score=14.42 TRINITY_DN21339_c0_g2_i1:156-548(-)